MTSNLGLHSISTHCIRQLLGVLERGDDNIDKLLMDLSFPVKMVLELDRFDRVGVDVIADPLLGNFALGIDRDYRVHLVETVDGMDENVSNRVNANDMPGHEIGTVDNSLKIEAFETQISSFLKTFGGGKLHLKTSKLANVSLEDPESLRAFVSDCELMYQAISETQTARFLMQQRQELAQHLQDVFKAQLEKIDEAVHTLQRRNDDLNQRCHEDGDGDGMEMEMEMGMGKPFVVGYAVVLYWQWGEVRV